MKLLSVNKYKQKKILLSLKRTWDFKGQKRAICQRGKTTENYDECHSIMVGLLSKQQTLIHINFWLLQ